MSKNSGDRFIPRRKNISSSLLIPSTSKDSDEFNFSRLCQDSILGSPQRLISFRNGSMDQSHWLLQLQEKIDRKYSIAETPRNINSQPFKILDAPAFRKDYYLNLLDWSPTGVVAIALSDSLYLWDFTSNNATQLCSGESDDEYISSVAWHGKGSCLALGMADGKLQIWDSNKGMKVKEIQSHDSRINCISSSFSSSNLLATAGKDKRINLNDFRIRNPVVNSFFGHTQEICGLKFSNDGNELASGANDNVLKIWDIHSTHTPKWYLPDHLAAVKAISWCPWQKGLLASGGGSDDKTIKTWNTNTGTLIQSVDTGSQVCCLNWSTTSKELISSHGYTENQITVWKYPNMSKVIELKGHTDRVLGLSLSPDGSMIASASADETLRFWKVFDDSSKGNGKGGRDLLRDSNLR